MHFALLYDPAPDYLERRKPFREAHLELVRELHAQGKVVMAGAFDPPDGALLVFRVDDAAEVEAFVKADPYVRNGVVTGWRIRQWTVVVGG
ncbi:MAG TPA: YciI-like protein [Anaeromyxobacter sp.]|nr:YciI-like protein [Anaeromyxobacter sp.]